jgi:hypothetical protein
LCLKIRVRRCPVGPPCTIRRSPPRTIHLRSHRTIHQVIQPMSRHSRAQTELQIRLVIRRVNCRAASRGADHHWALLLWVNAE